MDVPSEKMCETHILMTGGNLKIMVVILIWSELIKTTITINIHQNEQQHYLNPIALNYVHVPMINKGVRM